MTRPELSFDGHGINGPDEYRTRLFTAPRDTDPLVLAHYGPLLASAPDLLAALENLLNEMESRFDYTQPTRGESAALDQARAAIARAKNLTP